MVRRLIDRSCLRIRVTGEVNLAIDDVRFKMFAAWDDGIVDALYFKDRTYYELTELRLFKELAGRVTTILDVGANSGLYSIVSAKANPGARIYAFEPGPANRSRLKKNLALNRSDSQVTVIEQAVGEEKKNVAFAVPRDGSLCDAASVDTAFSRKIYDRHKEFEDIEVLQISLDEFVRSQEIGSVDLIKIDVENRELHVFRGAQALLAEQSPLILAEFFTDKERQAFVTEFIRPLGYSCYAILSTGLLRVSQLIDNPGSKNYLFSRVSSRDDFLPFEDMQELLDQIGAVQRRATPA